VRHHQAKTKVEEENSRKAAEAEVAGLKVREAGKAVRVHDAPRLCTGMVVAVA
jgi:hypothetical protein